MSVSEATFKDVIGFIPKFDWSAPDADDPSAVSTWSAKQQSQMMVLNGVMGVINAMFDNAKGWINQVSN